MSIEKSWEGRKRIYIPTCDLCGEQLNEQYDFDDAVESKKNAGWKSRKIDGEWFDLCPDCQSAFRRNRNEFD